MKRPILYFIFGLFVFFSIYADEMLNNELIPVEKVTSLSPYIENFMRTEDNNIVFVSATEYLDIKNMTINTLDLPETINGVKCFYPRPPFSNNKILLNLGYRDWSYSDINNNLYIYDIKNNETTLIDNISYWSLFPDGDRNFVTFLISTSEWWLGCLSRGDTLWLIKKDGNPLRQNENIDPLELILSEFNRTIFNDNYILETIRNINETRENLITKNAVIFFSGRQRDQNGDIAVYHYLDDSNVFYYFVNRMSLYFNIDIQNAFGFENKPFPTLMNSIGIYENGFFIFENNQIMLLDIRNHETKIYLTKESQEQHREVYGNSLFITNDAKTLLLKRLSYNRNTNTRENIIYKYEL